MADRKTTFDEWKKKVDAAVVRLCGLGADDLPDVDYWGMYEAGDTPTEAAREVVRNARNY